MGSLVRAELVRPRLGRSFARIGIGIILCLLAPTGSQERSMVSASPAAGIRGSDDPALIIRLVGEFDSAVPYVRLRRLVDVDRDLDQIWPELGSTVVHVEDGRFVRRGDVVRRLLGRGIPRARFQVIGPALCAWKRGESAATEEGGTR